MTPVSLAAVERWHAPLDEPGWAVCAFCNVPYPCDPMQMVMAIRAVLELPERKWDPGEVNIAADNSARGYNRGLAAGRRTLAAFVSEDES